MRPDAMDVDDPMALYTEVPQADSLLAPVLESTHFPRKTLQYWPVISSLEYPESRRAKNEVSIVTRCKGDIAVASLFDILKTVGS